MINETGLSLDGMTEVYWLADNLLMHQPLIWHKTVNESRAFRKENKVWLPKKETRMWGYWRRQNTLKDGAVTSSYLAFPAVLWGEITESSPDAIAPVPRTKESNEINIIGCCVHKLREKQAQTAVKAQKSSNFFAWPLFQRKKLTLLKGLLQCYPYILLGKSHF